MLNKKFLATLLATLALSVSAPAMADDDYDDDDYRPRRAQPAKAYSGKAQSGRQAVISRQRAGQIAKSQVKGGRVTDIDYDSYDDDYGTATYEVDVISGRNKYEVKINAVTGKVIRVKRDN